MALNRNHMDAGSPHPLQETLDPRGQRACRGKVVALPAAKATRLNELVVHVDGKYGRMLRRDFLGE